MSNNTIHTNIRPATIVRSIVKSGARGKSTYEIWLEEGHTGTEEDFLNWLKATTTFIHHQGTVAQFWTIEHSLNKYPSVAVVDSAETIVVGEVTYISINELQIEFSGGFSGKAYLN